MLQRHLSAIAVAAILAAVSAPAWSKSGNSGGFSSGSKTQASSNVKPPAPAIVKPPAPTAAPSPRPAAATSGGFSAATPKASALVPTVPVTPRPSAYDVHVNREMSSKIFETRQSPAFKAAVGDRTFTPQQVHEQRDTYFRTVYRDRYIPTQSGSGSYGSFSSGFMWAMIFNAAFAHNHADDPAYRQWRRDADERARNDEKLKAQLDDLDRQVKELEAKGAPKDPNFVPKDVPPEVIYSDDVLTTSPSKGHWSWLAFTLKVLLGITLIAGTFAIIAAIRGRRRAFA